MIIYEDLYTLREIYCKFSKTALEKNNEIMLIVTTYETPNNVRDMLRDMRSMCKNMNPMVPLS